MPSGVSTKWRHLEISVTQKGTQCFSSSTALNKGLVICVISKGGRIGSFWGNGRKLLININCKYILRIIILSTKRGSYWQDYFARHCNDVLANGFELAIKLVKC